MTAWCPRWTPSNTPIAKKSGPGNRSSSGIDRETSLSILCLSAAHPRDLGERKNSPRDLFTRSFFDLVDRDRVVDFEPSRFRPSQTFQMRAAAEEFANLVRVGPNIETFAAQNAEID